MSKHKEEKGAKEENKTPIENKQATAHGLAAGDIARLCSLPGVQIWLQFRRQLQPGPF